MRTLFRVFILSILVPALAFADTAGQVAERPRAEFSLAWGAMDRTGYYAESYLQLPTTTRNPLFSPSGYRHSGCITGGALINAGRGWAVGVAVSYLKISEPGMATYARQGYSFPGHNEFRRIVVALEGRRVFYSDAWMRLYARAGLGASSRDFHFQFSGGGVQSDESTTLGGHVSPFGLSIGRRVRGFAELGYGYRGLLSLGASAEF